MSRHAKSCGFCRSGDGCNSVGGSLVSEASGETAAPEQRDRFIPLRKSDIVTGLAANGGLDDDQQTSLWQFARVLGAIFHHRYFKELERLREAYFDFDPEVTPAAHGATHDLQRAYRILSEEFVRVLEEANFVEIPHEEIIRAFGEHALVRVKIKAPVEDYRDVRMFRRGHHQETIEVSSWYGLRRRPLKVDVYDDVVLMVATRPEDAPPDETAKRSKTLVSAWRAENWRGKKWQSKILQTKILQTKILQTKNRQTKTKKIRDGAVLFKYFRHIARGDLEALFPNVRVVMSLFDQLTLGVPAVVGGVPIVLKVASTMTILFVVAGFYLGLNGTMHDNDTEQALAALSGLFALGAFVLRQWGNFHRQSLIHQKQVTDNIYYRNINNNSGIFNYIIGEAEEQDWKETLLGYYGLLTAKAPLSREELGAQIEAQLLRLFGLRIAFAVDDALSKLKGLDLLREADGRFSVPPLADALARLETEWKGLLHLGAR